MIYLNDRDDSSGSRFFNEWNYKTILKYLLSCLSSNPRASKLGEIFKSTIPQEIALFITTAVRTSNPTYRYSDRLCHIEGNYLL
jgi:hypothetical protein